MGSLRLLAESYPPQELNEKGYSLYTDFRPDVDGWGKRGEVRCIQILSFRSKDERTDEEPNTAGRKPSRPHRDDSPPAKREKVLSLEEYEAALDKDFDNVDLSHLP